MFPAKVQNISLFTPYGMLILNVCYQTEAVKYIEANGYVGKTHIGDGYSSGRSITQPSRVRVVEEKLTPTFTMGRP